MAYSYQGTIFAQFPQTANKTTAGAKKEGRQPFFL